MDEYDHIAEYERIMDEHKEAFEKLEEILEWLSAHEEEYRKLMEWYCSDERNRDLEDDSNGLIPKEMRRGVLSEDGIWNTAVDHDAVAVRMMEVALEMIKSR